MIIMNMRKDSDVDDNDDIMSIRANTSTGWYMWYMICWQSFCKWCVIPSN
jgi:hypothetical protein